VVLDFGGQYTQLIDRGCANSRCSPRSACTTSIDEIASWGLRESFCGRAESVYDADAPSAIRMCWRWEFRTWAFAMGCSGSCTRSEEQ